MAGRSMVDTYRILLHRVEFSRWFKRPGSKDAGRFLSWAVPVLPLRFLAGKILRHPPALEARQQKRQPAEGRMAELHQGAAREFVQDRAVARRMQKMGFVEPRRLVG